jgi:hypothetical protein
MTFDLVSVTSSAHKCPISGPKSSAVPMLWTGAAPYVALL